MNCESCKERRKQAEPVPYIVHEGAMMRAEKREKRKDIIIIILILSLLISNIGWLLYESQFETFTYEYSQDGEGLNNINTGDQGDVYYGPEAESEG